MEIRIGTSGWHYKHWVGPFYPPKLPASKMLEFYRERFDTVELNNSFYRLPSAEAFAAWREAAPPGFLFAVKASRFITHNKKLGDAGAALDRLLERTGILEDKLGPILFQLPPQWQVNVSRLEEFLRILPRYHHYSFEFRNPTWNQPRVYEALRRSNAAYCIYHLAGFEAPLEITANFAYLRLHGPGNRYQGSYSDGDLRAWADRIRSWNALEAVYVYFDNDQAGYAALDALRLRRMLD